MIKFRYLYCLLVFLASLGTRSTAWSADYLSPRTAALGGAGHAAPILNDSIYLNPSFAAFNPGYAISAGYVNFAAMNYNLSVLDGRNEFFQAGVGYTRREDGKILHVGASRSFVQRTGFGLGAKFFFGKEGLPSGQDFSLSATGVVTEWIQVALITDNLLASDAGKARNLHREFILGTKVNIDKILLIYLDPQFVPSLPGGKSSYGHSLGAEFVVLRDFFWRLGSFRNTNVPWISEYANGYSTGLGWVGPRFSVDYAFTRVTKPFTDRAHTFGLTLYF